MPARDKLKALRLVERISRHQLESIGAELAGIRAEQAELDRKARALSAQASEEAVESTLDTRPYLPAYLGSVDRQQQSWSRKSAALDREAADIETRLLGAFRELKTRETVRDRAEQDVAAEAERVEVAMMDDAGRTLFLRNRALETGGK